MHGLKPRRDSNIEVIYPNLGNDLAQTPGQSWAWSTYNSTTLPAYPTTLVGLQVGMVASIPVSTSVFDEIEIEIATDPSGTPVKIHSIPDAIFGSNSNTASSVSVGMGRTYLLSPKTLPASTVLGVRSTEKNAVNTLRFNFYFILYNGNTYSLVLKQPDELRYIKGLTTSGDITEITVSPTTVAGNATTWVFGSWTQIIASMTKDTLIKGVTYGNPSRTTSVNFQGEIGIGSAGNEVSVGAFAGCRNLSLSAIGSSLLARPVLVKAGESVSLRIATALGTAGGRTFDFRLWGIELL